MSKRVAKVGTGSKDRHWVYGIIREMIEEDKYARFVDNGERYIIDWNEAIKRYWDFKSKKNPELKSKTFDRRKESNNLRTALLEHYKNEGAKEYIESIKKNDEGKIVERQFQMPLRIYKLLFENNAEMFHDKSAVDSPLEGTCSGGRYGDTSNEVDFLRGVVQEIQPLSGLVKGGYQFVISLKEQLPDDVTTGIVQFDGVAQVKAQRLNPYTLFGIVPPSHQPRDIVPVIVFTGAGQRLGITCFSYSDEMREMDSARDLNADLQEESEPIDTTMNESSFLNSGRNDQIVMNPVPNQRPAVSTGTENGTSSTGGERMVQNPAIYAESSGMEDIARDLNADLQEESEPIDTTMNESSFLNRGRNDQIVMNPVPNQIPAVITGTENGTLSTGGERMVQNPAIYPKSSGMEGGEEFHITFPEPLAQEVTSGVALFKGVGYAPLTKYSQCDLIGIVPPSTKPGIFDVGVLDQTGDYLGTTKFSYTSPALLEKVQQVLRDGNLDTLYVYFMLTQKFGSLQVSVGDNNAAQGSDPLNMQDQG